MLDIKQAVNRLENASTGSERIAALGDLQSLSREHCEVVGESILQFVLDLLKENGESDEYIEALELISKLVKPKKGEAAVKNAKIITKDVMNVELLLDLLEHEDGLVGVMASEILTNIHTIAAKDLEMTIQECPAGMTKLLNRMPDRTREEVSDQAIILIRQLTSSNEEMKKTVAFNEGFEMIFGIIESEGGYKEASAVVQDCLEICCNVLDGSDICQRLFYGMGGGWHLRLLDFFSPSTMESLSRKPPSISPDHGEEDRDNTFIDFAQHGPWFEQNGRLKCAILAITSLLASMGISGAQHSVVAPAGEEILTACAHWIIRRGPEEMLLPCFYILNALAKSPEKSFAQMMFTVVLRYIPSSSGLHVPASLSSSQLQFSWKPSSSDDRRAISFVNLLAERYLFPTQCWFGHESSTRDMKPLSHYESSSEEKSVFMVGSEFWMGALHVIESLLASDETTSGMIMQNILAPPPPPSELDDAGMPAEVDSMQMEFGSLVMAVLLNSLERVVVHQGGAGASASGGQHSLQTDAALAIRAANIMSLILVHGGLLARELSTAISTGHLSAQRAALDLSLKSQNLVSSSPTPVLPYLLSLCSRIVRVPGVGFNVSGAVLRLLSAAACSCERASTQMLEDPANFFVVDLATRNSESAGVPESMQIACCHFLGACFASFPAPTTESNSGSGSWEPGMMDTRLSRTSILGMIDSKIGLSRFSDLLKRPTSKAQRSSSQDYYNPESLFFCDSFKAFYVKEMESIRTGIFDFYSGSTAAGVDSTLSPEGQVIKMQKETITQLEEELKELRDGVPSSETASSENVAESSGSISKEDVESLQNDIANLKAELAMWREKSAELDVAFQEKVELVESMAQSETALVNEVESLRSRLDASQKSLLEVKEQLRLELAKNNESQPQSVTTEIPEHVTIRMDALAADNAKLREELSARESSATNDDNIASNGGSVEQEEEILKLKEKIVNLSSAKKALNDEVDTLNRKLTLLEEDLLSPMPYDKVNASKITELESRNASLKTELWEMESNMSSMKGAMDSELSVLQATVNTLVNACEVGENDYLMPSSEYSEGGTLPQLLARKVEGCIEIVQYVAGRSSDYGEVLEIYFDSPEDKPMQRCMEVVEKVCGQYRLVNEKVHEGERFRDQLGACEVELESLQESYDSVLSRLEEKEIECEKLRVSDGDAEDQTSSTDVRKMTSLFEKISTLQASLAQTEARNVEMEAALKKLTEQTESDQSHISTLNEVIKNISEKMENMQQSSSGGDKSESTAERDLKLLQVELQGALDENMDLCDQIAKGEKDYAECIRALEEKATAYEAVLVELDALRVHDGEAEKTHQQENKQSLEELRQTISLQEKMHNEIVDDLKLKLEATLTELNELRTNDQDAKKLREEDIQALEELRQVLTEQENSHNETVNELKSQLEWLESDAESASSALSVAEKERTEYKAKLATCEHNLSQLEMAHNETVSLLQAQYRLVAETNKEKNLLSQQLSDCKQSLAELESSHKQTVSILQTHYRLVAEYASKVQKYEEELQSKSMADTDGMEALMDHVMKLEIELRGVKEENSALSKKVEQKDGDMANTSRALEYKTVAYETALAEIEELRNIAESASNDTEEVLALRAQRDEAIHHMESENSDLRERLIADEKIIEELRAEVDHLLEEKQALLNDRKQFEEELDDVKALANGYDAAIQAREEEVEAMQQSMQAKDEELRAMQADHHILREALEGKEKEYESVKSALEKKATEYSKVLEKFLQLKEQRGSQSSNTSLSDLTTANSRLSKEVSEIREELHRCEEQKQELLELTNSQAGKIAGYDQIISGLENDLEAKEIAEDGLRSTILDLQNQVAVSVSCAKSGETKEWKDFADNIKAYCDFFEQKVSNQIESQSDAVEGIVGKTTHRLEKAQRGIALIATALSQQKELLQGREQDLLEKESRVNHLEKQLADAKRSRRGGDLSTPPPKNTKQTTSPLTSVFGATPTHIRDAARLQADIRKERQKLNALQEQHTDLLGLLAQQEIELQIFKEALLSRGGSRACNEADSEVRRVVTERYGSYVSFRDPGPAPVDESVVI